MLYLSGLLDEKRRMKNEERRKQKKKEVTKPPSPPSARLVYLYNGHDCYRRTGETYKNNRRTTCRSGDSRMHVYERLYQKAY